MPVEYKHWFIKRIQKELSRDNKEGESTPTRALHQNSPDIRALQGMAREEGPSRTRRFT